jgi:signal transduction histidine kinase
MHPIMTTAVNCELDVIASRQRARQIAAFCGFGIQDQARIATAVSELARNIFNYAPAGKVRFAVSDGAGGQALVIAVEDNGSGIRGLDAILAGNYCSASGGGGGIAAARRFMDQCKIETGSNGTYIVLSKDFPPQAPLMTSAAITQAVSQLQELPSNVALAEANQQNQELTDALATLQVRQAELIEVSQRLEETNKKVETLNRLLSEKAESLVSADRRKDDFLSILSHELRGPLSAASMAAHVLERTSASPEQTVKLGQVITRQVSHMSRLVEDLLDVSRVSRGLVSIDRAPLDMRDVIGAALEQVAPAARQKKQRVEVSLPDTACVVDGDRTRLIQVVGNVLGNAIRYTPDGGQIDVSMRVQEGTLAVTVTDNGIGITPDLMPHLFDLYVQAERTSDSKNGGLGLGLALVKSLVEIHNGTVTASSDGVGHGSTFEISLGLSGTGGAASAG